MAKKIEKKVGKTTRVKETVVDKVEENTPLIDIKEAEKDLIIEEPEKKTEEIDLTDDVVKINEKLGEITNSIDEKISTLEDFDDITTMHKTLEDEIEKLEKLETEVETKIKETESKMSQEQKRSYNQMMGAMWNGQNYGI